MSLLREHLLHAYAQHKYHECIGDDVTWWDAYTCVLTNWWHSDTRLTLVCWVGAYLFSKTRNIHSPRSSNLR
jgi:hypothetical protein